MAARNRLNGFEASWDVVKLLKQFGDPSSINHPSEEGCPMKGGCQEQTSPKQPATQFFSLQPASPGFRGDIPSHIQVALKAALTGSVAG